MEISKDGFRSLPKEIVQQIISYLDHSSEATLRATNRLFRALLFTTDFEIASNDVDWSDVSDRLLKHYNTTLIGLIINLPTNHEGLVESISKLSNLSTLKTSGCALSAEQFEKLTDLVNMHEFDIACKAPSAVISYWSNLTKLRCYNKNHSDFPFSSLRALKQLQLFHGPDVDLSKNTNLTSLLLRVSNSTIGHLVKLRTLNMTLQTTNPFFRFLTDLEDLQMESSNLPDNSVDDQFLSSINSKRLTRLYISTVFQQIYYGDLTRLTTLQALTILERSESDPSGRINMSTLANLTYLSIQTTNISDFEEVSKVTKLKDLEIEVPRDCNKLPFNATLSALTNLEQLRLYNLAVSSIESDLCFMKNLTDLIVELNDNSDYKFLEIAPIELLYNRALIRSGQFWSTVTKCTTLQSLIHTCESVSDDVIYSLTTLSHLTQLSFRYTGQVNQECFTALTMLQTLDFTTLGDGTPVDRDWLLEHMTWLKDLYVS